MVTSLAGRSALVTGAGSPDGIGFACAELLADLGMTVHVSSTTQRIYDRAAALGISSVGVIADLTVEGEVDGLHEAQRWSPSWHHPTSRTSPASASWWTVGTASRGSLTQIGHSSGMDMCEPEG